MMNDKRRGTGGFSLVEMMLVVTILGVLAQALVEATESMGALQQRGTTHALLQEQGDRAQRAILDDLRWSGIRDVDGRRYPFVFEGNAPDSGYDEHAYTPGPQQAVPGDDDFGAPHSLIIVRPSDLDGDQRPDFDLDRNGTPELDGNGDGVLSEDAADLAAWSASDNTIDAVTGLVWGHGEISYVVVAGPGGRNQLQRRWNANAATAEILAHDVERLDVQTSEDTGFSIPTNSLRIGVYFRKTDSNGANYTHQVEFVVRLRNGELSL